VLLPADIEQGSETELLQMHRDALHADVLIAPHHGSGTSSSTPFLAQVAPSLIVIPVGYRNRFGHPKPEVVARYEALGSRVLRSDQDGAVLLRFGAEGLLAEGYRGRATGVTGRTADRPTRGRRRRQGEDAKLQ
jgi:competence protein ComEC